MPNTKTEIYLLENELNQIMNLKKESSVSKCMIDYLSQREQEINFDLNLLRYKFKCETSK